MIVYPPNSAIIIIVEDSAEFYSVQPICVSWKFVKAYFISLSSHIIRDEGFYFPLSLFFFVKLDYKLLLRDTHKTETLHPKNNIESFILREL